MKKRRIIFITERRADYSRLRPLLKATYRSANVEPRIVVTGMHLLKRFGETYKEILRDRFRIDAKVPVLHENDPDTGEAMAKALGNAVVLFTDVFKRLQPDIIVTGFDLGLHLAAAIAGLHQNIHVAHLEGGSISGSVDDTLRHALTKFSHLHFPVTDKDRKRIIRLGEDPRFVWKTGSLSLDTVKTISYPSREEVCRVYGLDPRKKLIVFLEHPVTTEERDAEWHMQASIHAVQKAKMLFGAEVLAIYPNADAGGKRMLRLLRASGLRAIPNLPYEEFLRLLKIANVLVGNSSAGIQEAPSFRLPVVNVGTRQQRRERGANVIDVSYKEKEILAAIKKSLFDKRHLAKVKTAKNPYDGGNTAKKILKILESIKLPPVQKVIHY